MRYSEQFMEHIEYAFHAFCKIVLRHEAMNAWRDLKRKEEREISQIETYFNLLSDASYGIIKIAESTPGSLVALLLHWLS